MLRAMLCGGSAGFDGVATSGLLAILAIASASATMEPRALMISQMPLFQRIKADKAACYHGEVEDPGTASEATHASTYHPTTHRVLRATSVSPATRMRRAAVVLAALFANISH
jgi:hypothetical protein